MQPKFIFPFIEASLYTIGAGCVAWFGFQHPFVSKYTTIIVASLMAFSVPFVYNFAHWLMWKENVNTQVTIIRSK